MNSKWMLPLCKCLLITSFWWTTIFFRPTKGNFELLEWYLAEKLACQSVFRKVALIIELQDTHLDVLSLGITMFPNNDIYIFVYIFILYWHTIQLSIKWDEVNCLKSYLTFVLSVLLLKNWFWEEYCDCGCCHPRNKRRSCKYA